MTELPPRVKIVEVGPRDGLQNETEPISTGTKLEFIRKLAQAGLREIEVASFVHPERVPQLADAEAVVGALAAAEGPVYSALVPNARGLDRAIASGIGRIAVFTGASDTFTRRNIGMDLETSLVVFRPLVSRALAAGLTVRGYVSTCFGCPYEGDVSVERVLFAARSLLEMGADEVSLGDTIGVAVPTEVWERLQFILPHIPSERIALHFHDTSGTALANVLAALELGIAAFDSSAGGLGGCPFAPGASGNLATEDLVYMLARMGIETGVSLEGVVEASGFLEPHLGHALPSRQYRRVRSLAPG